MIDRRWVLFDGDDAKYLPRIGQQNQLLEPLPTVTKINAQTLLVKADFSANSASLGVASVPPQRLSSQLDPRSCFYSLPSLLYDVGRPKFQILFGAYPVFGRAP
jgi:hypothetical protein